MPSDLDRAYIINGDDLRIALSKSQWNFRTSAQDEVIGWLRHPAEVAEVLLEDAARPYGGPPVPAGPGVTVSQLATALEGFQVTVRDGAWRQGEGDDVFSGTLADADEVAGALHATLSRMAALRGDQPSRWPVTRGELAARLGRALERTGILIRNGDYEPLDGDFGWTHAARPGDLAEELVEAIGAQGTEDDRGGLPRVNPGNAVDEALQRCRAALSWCSPDNRERIVSALAGDVIKTGTPRLADPPEPIVLHMGDPEHAAIGCVLAALGDLDAPAVRRIIRYLADRHNVEVIP